MSYRPTRLVHYLAYSLWANARGTPAHILILLLLKTLLYYFFSCKLRVILLRFDQISLRHRCFKLSSDRLNCAKI